MIRWIRSRRFWQRTAFTLASLVTLIITAGAIENYRGQRAWERYRAEAKSRGVNLDWSHYIPAGIPDSDNFAATTLFRRLCSPDKTVQANALGAPIPNWPVIIWNFSSRDGKPMNLGALQQWLLNEKQIDHTTNDAAADVLGFLERYEPVLQEQRMALARSGGRLPSHWEKGFNSDIFQFGNFFGFQMVLRIRIAALLRQGRSEEALEDWNLIRRTAELFRGEPSLYACMSRVLMTGLLIDPVAEGLLGRSWPAPTLREMEKRLSTIDLISDLRFGFTSERALTTFTFSQIKIGGPGVWPEGTDSKLWPLLYELMPGIVDQNLVLINKWYDRQLTHLSLNDSSGLSYLKANRPTRNWFSRYYWALSDTALFAIANQESVARQFQASIALCRCACAAEQYRLSYGRYPEGVDALVPEFLREVPEDSFGTGRIKSLNRDGELLFYSVGIAGKNERADMEELTWKVRGRN